MFCRSYQTSFDHACAQNQWNTHENQIKCAEFLGTFKILLKIENTEVLFTPLRLYRDIRFSQPCNSTPAAKFEYRHRCSTNRIQIKTSAIDLFTGNLSLIMKMKAQHKTANIFILNISLAGC